MPDTGKTKKQMMNELVALRRRIADLEVTETRHKRIEKAIQQSENTYHNLFKESRDAVYISTREGKFADVNQSMLELFGYTREEMMNLDVPEIYARPEDRERFQQRIEQEGSIKNYELQLRCKDGTERDCLVTASVRKAKDGHILGYQGIISDITERKQLEEERQKAAKLESIGTLAGGIAHDFNNLLTGIMGNISLALRLAEPDSKSAHRLQEAEKAALRARDLTQQLLTFARGGTPIKKLSSITEIMEGSTTFALRGSNVKPEFMPSDDIWPVEVDEGQISQVISNIALNAVQAMPEGGTLKIGVRNTVIRSSDTLPLPPGNYVQVTMQDEGIGIPKEHLSKIFDPYFTTKQRGSGLGLATTYSIIKSHGGQITVESELGVGTSLCIYLPASEKRTPARKKTAVQPPLMGKGRILVMDDEEAIRILLSKILTAAGYDVELSKDGAEAIEQYAKAKESGQPFNAIIMDLTIPGGMGGKQAIEKLLEIDPDVRAVVSSGYSTDPIMSEYKKYGFSGVVAKPYQAGDLEDILRNVIFRMDE